MNGDFADVHDSLIEIDRNNINFTLNVWSVNIVLDERTFLCELQVESGYFFPNVIGRHVSIPFYSRKYAIIRFQSDS